MSFLLLACAAGAIAQPVYRVQKCTISFNSDAPNELIKATSKELKGLVNPGKKQFAFAVVHGVIGTVEFLSLVVTGKRDKLGCGFVDWCIHSCHPPVAMLAKNKIAFVV